MVHLPSTIYHLSPYGTAVYNYKRSLISGRSLTILHVNVLKLDFATFDPGPLLLDVQHWSTRLVD